MLFDVKPTYVITRTHTLSPHYSTSKRVGREFNRDRLWGVNTHGHLQCWWFTDFIFETSSANLLSRAHHYKRRLSLVWVHSFGPSVCVHMCLGWACRAKPKMDALKDSILIFKVIPNCYFLRFFLMEENWVGIKKRISWHVFLVGSFQCSSTWRWIQYV